MTSCASEIICWRNGCSIASILSREFCAKLASMCFLSRVRRLANALAQIAPSKKLMKSPITKGRVSIIELLLTIYYLLDYFVRHAYD